MKLIATCPDCEKELLQVVALPNDTKDFDTIGEVIQVAEGKVGWCSFYEHFWEAETKYDAVFAGKHQGDPK